MLQRQSYSGPGLPFENQPLPETSLLIPNSPQNINIPPGCFDSSININYGNLNNNQQPRIISQPSSVAVYPTTPISSYPNNPHIPILPQVHQNIPANNTLINSNIPANFAQTSEFYQRITTVPQTPTRPSPLFYPSPIRQNVHRSSSPILQNQYQRGYGSQPLPVHSHSQQIKRSRPYNVRFFYLNPPQNPPLAPQNINTYPVMPLQPIQYIPPPQNFIQNQITNQTITTTTIVWQHRFVQIYSKFQIFVEKFETIVQEIYYIDDLFDNVNDEQAWNDLRVKYTEVIDKFNQMRQQIILVLEQNKAAINSLSPEVVRELEQRQQEQEHNQQQHQKKQQQQHDENQQIHEEGGLTGQSENQRVWENRYLELMQQYQLVNQENMAIKAQLDRVRIHDQQGTNRKARDSERENNKLIEMQKNLNTIHVEYQKLEDNYAKLSQQYTRVVRELQKGGRQGGSDELSELQSQLQMAEAKIQDLYQQIHNKDEHIIGLEKEIESAGQILQQNKTLIETINKLHQDLEYYATELKKKDEIAIQYDTEVKNLHEQMMQMSHALEQFQKYQQPQQINPQEYERKVKQVQVLQEKQKGLLTLIEKHEESIQEMALKIQRLTIEYEAATRDREEQTKMYENLLEEQRVKRQKLLSQGSFIHTQPHQNIAQASIFKERLQIEIQQIVAEKNRKIKSLTQDIEDIKQQLETREKDKAKSIKQIRDYFAEQEQKYVKKLQDKDNNLKLLNDKIKALETELSSRNFEISRFRVQSPTNSFNPSNEETKRFNEAIERRNHEMQQLRKTLEKKSLDIKELEHKIFGLEQELHSKIFEINSLKRQIFDSHGTRAEIDNLNNIIKKKNQQINELRLSIIEIEQLKLNMDGLERQKIRLNEYLKEKTRECESKDSTIQSLQRKLNTYSFEAGATNRKYTGDFDRTSNIMAVSNYESLLRQKETEIKNLKYELEMLETKMGLGQKTIRDLNNKISTNQRSSSVAKAQMQNKISKYEAEIKELNKQIKNLKANKQQLTNIIESMQIKNNSFSKSLDERNSIYDSELRSNKLKISEVEKQNTLLLVDQEVLKGQIERLNQENRDLNDKIKAMQDKIQSKNKAINEIKGNFDKKEKEDIKSYEQKIKKLDGQLKFSAAKLKNMEEEIVKLNKKISSAEHEKRSYRERLITEGSNQKQEFIDFRYASEHYDYGPHEVLEMQRFKLKDPDANNVFERKVIYDLKRENDMLRRQLSGMGMGMGSYSMNRLESQHNRFSSYQQDALTQYDRVPQRDDQHNLQILSYHKSKNKQLEERIDELLKVNKELNEKIKTMNQNSANQFSIAFFKQQIAKLESDNAQLQARIKQILSDHESIGDELTGYQHEAESLKMKLNEQNSMILQLKNTIKTRQQTIVQLQNAREILMAEVERLKQLNERKDKYKQVISQKDREIFDQNRRQKNFQQQIARLTNKNQIQSQQIQRLNEIIRNKKSELDNRFELSNEETKKLRKRIIDLQKQLQYLKFQQDSSQASASDLVYRIQKIRSYFIEIDALVGELPLIDSRAQHIAKQIHQQIQQGFKSLSLIQL